MPLRGISQGAVPQVKLAYSTCLDTQHNSTIHIFTYVGISNVHFTFAYSDTSFKVHINGPSVRNLIVALRNAVGAPVYSQMRIVPSLGTSCLRSVLCSMGVWSGESSVREARTKILVCIYIYLSIYLSISLSLSIYIYIYMSLDV